MSKRSTVFDAVLRVTHAEKFAPVKFSRKKAYRVEQVDGEFHSHFGFKWNEVDYREAIRRIIADLERNKAAIDFMRDHSFEISVDLAINFVLQPSRVSIFLDPIDMQKIADFGVGIEFTFYATDASE